MTGLPTDQLIEITASVADVVDPGEVDGWSALDLFDSVLVTAIYLRQNTTEDFLAAIVDVSQATISKRRTMLEKPITTVLAGVKPDPAASHAATAWSWTGPWRQRATGRIWATCSPASTTAPG